MPEKKSTTLILKNMKRALGDAQIRKTCLADFSITFEKIGMEKSSATALAKRVIEEIIAGKSLKETERRVVGIFEKTRAGAGSFLDALKSGMRGREDIIIGQLGPLLMGTQGKVLDFGAGSGNVAQALHDRWGLDMDAVDVSDFKNKGLSISLLLFDGKRVPVADQYYEAALASNVLHHEAENEVLLKELTRVVRKKLVILETVPADSSPEAWDVTFVNDTLWNRFFFLADVPVPGTYESAEGWIKRFRRYGWKPIHSEFLGYDQPAVRVLHHLFVFERTLA